MKKNLLSKIKGYCLSSKVFICLIALLFTNYTHAQTIGNYAGLSGGTFTAASGTFTSISGTGTSISFVNNDDGTVGPVPLGFTFVYMGVGYTSCFVNTNGYISFSPIAPLANATYGPLSTTAANFHPAICAYLEDLQGPSTVGYFQTTGSAGSRVFTFELKDWGIFTYVAPPSFSLQIKVYEGTGKIELVYDNLAGTQTDFAAIGLTASSAQYLGLDNTSSSPTPGTTASTISSAGKPASGQIYRFEPPTNVGSGTSFSSFANVKPTSLQLNWAHSTPGSTIGYLIEKSNDGGSTYTIVGTSFTTSYNVTGLTPATAYKFRITPVTEGYVGSSIEIVTSSQSTSSCSSFSGTLQIGPSGNFPSITKAIDSLNSMGFTGNLILELQSSYNSSVETFPVTIPDFRTFSCNNGTSKITIRPASGASNLVITGSATTLFILDNAYKFTFDGRPGGTGTANQIHMINTSTTGTVFTLQNDAIGNTIRNCNIRSANATSSSGAIFIGGTVKLYGNDSNLITNNVITKAVGATLASGITSAGTNLLLQNDNNSILNNEIHSWTSFGVNVTSSVGNGPNWNISNNSFYDSSATTSTSFTAINFIPGTTSNSTGNIISGNFIGGTTVNAGGTPWIISSTSATMGGIRITCNAGMPTLIQNNVIQNISFTNISNSATFMGINPAGGSVIIGGAPGKGNTIGNAITGNSIVSVGSNPMIGISASTSNDIEISYNTIANITQNQTTATLATGAIRGIVNTGGVTVNIKNNIIKSFTSNTANAGTSTSASLLGIAVSSGASNQNILDNIIGGPNTSDGLSSTSTTALTRVIGIVNISGITLIKGNKINGLFSSAPSTGTTTSAAIIGLYNSGTAGCIVDNNEIRNINATAVTTTTILGMYIGNTTDITNNLISGLTTASTYTGTTSIACIQGIYYGTTLPATILNNTLENFSATSNAGTQIVGINSIATLTYITNNKLRNFSSNSNSASTISGSSILGIGITSATANKNISGNRIYNFYNYNSTSAAAILGIYFTTTTAFGNSSVVNNNFIHSFKLATSGIGNMTGIYNASGVATFQNNMISLGVDSTGSVISGPYNIKGIVHGITSSSNYYHNSIYLAGSSAGTTNTACMEFTSTLSTTETVNLKNNIFYNNISNSSTGRNACIRIISVNGRIFSNHNILYAPNTGGAIGIVNTTAYTSLTGAGGWNSIFLMDGNSGSTDPNFIAPNGTSSTVDLHLSSSNPAEGAGDPMVTISDDFDGELRSGLTPVDIGADAGNFTRSGDVFPPIINLVPLTNTSSTGDRTFTVNIIDNGSGMPLTTANAPRVYYKNGTGTVFNALGTLVSGTRQNGTWSFTINASAMGGLVSGNIISYYIVAQDSAGNVVSNAMYAIASGAGSVTTDPVTPNTYTIVTALSTTIDVGTGQTYTSLTETGAAGLFNAINTSGLQGNTIINITSDLTETGAIALNQWDETGSGNYTLTIRPSAASRRTLSGTASPTGGLIRLNGADRVKITGIPSGGSVSDTFLLIKSTSSSVSALTLMSDAVNNTIENCVIESSPSIGFNVGAILISPTVLVTGNDNNTFIRCHIRAINGTGLPVGIFSSGNSPSGILPVILHDNITIRECHFYNWTTNGISVTSIGNGDRWRILNNHFYRTAPTAAASAQTAINFIPGISSNNDTISGNFIGGTGPNAGGSTWTNSALSAFNGIVVNAGIESTTQVQNNTIKKLLFSNTGTLSALFTGINITGGIVDVGGTTGNIIGDVGAANSIQADGDAGLTGINSTTAYKLTISNNTVSNLTSKGGTLYTSTSVRGITVTSGTFPLNVNNNTVKNLTATSRNTGSSSSAAVVGIGVGSSGTIQNIMNNTVQNLKNLDNVGTHCMVGIYTTSGLNIVKGNVISGLISGSASTSSNSALTGIIGMLMQSNLGGSEYSNNSISDMQYASSTPVGGQMVGLLVNSSGAGLKITNNTISSLNSVSISTGTASGSAIIGLSFSTSGTFMSIENNTIHSLNHNNSSTANGVNIIGLYNTGAGFATGTTSLAKITRNLIHSLKLSTTGTGSMYGIYNASGFSLFENNMVRVGIDSSGNAFAGPYNVHGIYQSFANNNVMYYHNSVYTGGAPSSGASNTSAFSIATGYVTASTRAIIKNNIFVNAVSNTGSATGKNYAIKLVNQNLIISNYNILYASGSGGYTAGTATDYKKLSGDSSWQMASGLDLNSGSGDPGFIDATGKAMAVNLRLKSSNPAEGQGTTDVSTTLDFDGNTRSARTPADIGANSGNFTLSSDIISPSISYNSLLNSSVTTGTKTLSNVMITDNVGIPMTGTDIPRIYFSKNGTTWYSSAASAITGTAKNAVASFDITYSTMGGVAQGDTIRYYVIAQDNAGNIISNGLYAVASDVHTIMKNPLVPNSYKIVPSLASGTKLKVGTGKTYPNLTGYGGLFEYLNSVALSGDISAVISSNTSEPGFVALNELGDNGSGTFTLTIRPDSLTTSERILSGNLSFGMIRLNGADRIKFTGVPDFNGSTSDKKLRFRNTATSGQVFSFLNEALDNRLHNLNIEGGNTSVALGTAGLVLFGTSNKMSGNSSDTVSNCVFGHDQSAILPLGVPAVDIHSFGTPDKNNSANIIMGNEFTNFTQHGVMISNVGNGNSWSITGNSFYRNLPFPAFTLQQSIAFDPSVFSGGHTISYNYIGGSAKNCGGSPWFHNVNLGFRGISCTFTSLDNPTNISNNVIQNIHMDNMGTGSQFIGLAIISAGNFNITNNLLGHPTNINSISLAGAAGHIGILTQSNSIVNIRGNAVQGINIKTAGVTSSFLGISLFFGYAKAVNNTVGSATVANSIQYAGASTITAIQSIVATTTAPIVLIDSNTVANITATGPESNIQVKGIYYNGSSEGIVTNNKVFNLSTNSSNSGITPFTSAINGIAHSGGTMGGAISNNTVYNIRAINTGAVATSATGIGLTSANNVVISKNRIYDIINLSTNTNIGIPATAVGINISSPQNMVTMQNNQISLGTGQTNSPMFIGIWQSASGNFQVNSYFNSVYIGGTASSGLHSSFGYLRGNNLFSTSFTSIVNAKNNIFMNDRKGGSGKHYAIGNQSISTTFQTGWLNNASNYNFLSNSSSYPMGLWNITDYNFSEWKSNTNNDLNSIYMPAGTSTGQMNAANLFQNAAAGNLSLIKTNSEALVVQGKAIPIAGITTDFDNLTRNATAPTIGSSEAFPNDVGVTGITSPLNNTCGKPVTTVTVTVKNFGLQNQSNIPIRIVGSGAATFNFSEVVAGPIAPGQTVSYTSTGTFNSSAGGTYMFKSFTNSGGDGVRANDTSSLVTINIYPLPKPSFTYTDTCAGNTTMFTSTSTVTGGTIASNFWKFGDGATATGNTATHMYATPATTYTAKLISTSNNGCVDSTTRNVTILSNVAGGTIGTNQTICYNTTPSLLTNTTAASGSLAPYTYQWQSSGDNITFNDISGATALTYQPGALTVTMYYRRSVKTTSGCGPAFSNVVKITTNAPLTGGVIGSAQTICFNGSGSALTFSTTPTGGFGTYTYQWQSSPDSSAWSNISGQTSTSFTPTNVTSVTYYRALVFSGSCASVGSNGVKIKLYSPITGGSIAAGQTICAGTTPAAFTQTSAPSGGPGTYTFQWQSSTDSINWNNISGATSATYSSPAILTLTYFQRLAGSAGCPSGTSNALKVRTLPKPNVAFTASNHCFNDQMPLSNSSSITSGTLTYLWKFGDGTTSTSSVPNKTYSSSGTYNVTLTATSNLGCKDSLVKSVIVATTPLPAFSYTLKCQGDSVIFKDETVYACGAGSGLVFHWNFGDGTTSNVQHARHHYSPGTYNVKFRISLPGGFKDSVTQVLVFNIRSTPNFNATNDCYPAATTFTNSSTNYSTLTWSFGDGSTSTSTAASFTKTYAVAGVYNAKLVSTSSFGCKDSLTKAVSVYSKPKATFSVSNNCVGFTTSFNNASSGATSYQWKFGDGNTSASVNPTNTYSSAGTYTVVLKVTSVNGCIDSTINTVTIYPKPTADFTTANVCHGFVSTFTNTSTGAVSYNWNFGNGNTSSATNPTYTYPVAGNYTVTLIATSSNGCTQSTSKTYTVNSAPTAAFTGSNVCLGNSITFNNTSTGASGNTWNFGDATTSTATNPTKTYSNSGNFSVKLVVTNTFGCKDSVSNTITIYARPVPAFSASNKCLGTAVDFVNQSTGGVSTIWSFGDGKSSASNSPTYSYATAGTYSVKLVVTSVNSCKDSITKTITVYPKPVVSFTASPNPICRGGLMNFTNTTTNGASYSWTFGNGAVSSATSPSNIYTTAGNYNVKLVSVSTNGCKDSAFRTVTVWPRPVASFMVNNGCTGDNLSFATNSVGAVSHAWTFGDGNTSTAANPSKGYTAAGTYNVKLIVTSINGCMDTTNSNVTVHPRATVSFTNPSNFCVGSSTTFTNTSVLSSGTMTHQWTFGDGNSSSAISPTNTYGTGGNYTVILTTTTDKGCINSNTSTILVYSKPTANFNAKGVCQGGTVTFNNTTSGGSTYTWDFGDAGSSTLTSPTHVYTNAGTYNVKLTATNANNCTDVITRQITIFANPVANFTVTDRCVGVASSFTNTSSGATDVLWQFGDGNSSNGYSPTYTYTTAGSYNVTLNVKSSNGCLASVTKTVNVNAAPKAGFGINDNGQCVNSNNFIYTDNSTISSGSYTRAWTLGDGSNSTAANPSKTYINSGNYNVKLVVTSNNGCKDSAMNMVMVYPKPVANFNINNTAQCLNGNLFQFTDASTIADGSLSRVWNLGDGSQSGGTIAVKKYDAIGTYTIRLNVTSDFGCNDSISKSVTVNPSPTASFTINDDIQCLNGNNFSFTNTTTGVASFNSSWNFGDGSTLSTTNSSRTYSAAGNYKVTLNVSTPSGCKDSAYYTMKVSANPAAIAISGSTTVFAGSNYAYSVPSTPGSSYNWVATNGIVLSNGGSTIQVRWNAVGSGTLSVTETGANGCQGNAANYNVTVLTSGIHSVTRNAFAASLYPNPSKDNFTIEVSTGDMVNMSIYDNLGREVISGQRFSNSITISDHNLAAGIYTAKLTTDKGRTSILRFEVSN